jgi:2-oxoglutarate dehydrogenase E1 component
MDKFSYLSNAHTAYLDELYNAYKQNPESVDISWQKFFEGFEFSQQYAAGGNGKPVPNGTSNGTAPAPTAPAANRPGVDIDKEIQVRNLIYAYRSRGHLKAKTNPVRPRKDRKPLLDLKDFGLSDADLDTVFESGKELGFGPAPLRQILDSLKIIYEGTVGFEYMYIREPEILEYFKRKVEKEALEFNPGSDEKKRILFKLNEAVVFENFLHTKYIGQKRFSLEGGETTIPALDAIINEAAEQGVVEVVIGMAHRGRLNVLCNTMGKTYETIFNEFEGTATPDLTMGDGDVKYHMGYASQITTPTGKSVQLKLAPNPSHLEAVNPVVEGYARAKADVLYESDYDKVLPILIHGDAAVAGQGIVYEVTQMSKLAGYYTGGTIHFVINNQVGFTTDFEDARSSIYSTDVAKIIDAPVLHVNGDDPEAVVFCAKLAADFRQRFNRDIFIDMVCYRATGTTKATSPKFTQPTLYNTISKHPNPREIYNKKLIARGDVDAELAQKMDDEFRSLLQDRLNSVKQKPLPYFYQKNEEAWKALRRSTPEDFDLSPQTGITPEIIEKVARKLVTCPKASSPSSRSKSCSRTASRCSSTTSNSTGRRPNCWPTAPSCSKTRSCASPARTCSGVRSRTATPCCTTPKRTRPTTASTLRKSKREGDDLQLPALRVRRAGLRIRLRHGQPQRPGGVGSAVRRLCQRRPGDDRPVHYALRIEVAAHERPGAALPHGYEGQGPEHSNARPNASCNWRPSTTWW